MKISDELKEDWVHLSPYTYRPGTIGEKLKVNFMFYGGGIGDYICWSSAILYVLENHLHVQMALWTQSHFTPVAKKLFSRFGDRVEFKDVSTVDQYSQEDLNPALFPLETPNGVGMHMIDVGFAYFARTQPHGKYKEHVRLDVSDVDISSFNLPEKYAVVTTGHTSPTRVWKSAGVNGVSDYLVKNNITPVFLGKRVVYVAGDRQYKSEYEEGIDFSKGLDLRDKTDILQAAAIMAKAKVVVGLDNGLLHLAGTQEVPIVMGLTITIPADRSITRPKAEFPKNETTFISPDSRKLACSGCQSKMRFHKKQDFAFCYYKDYKCLDVLNDPGHWINAIRRYLTLE